MKVNNEIEQVDYSKIGYSDLTWDLKVAVVTAWILAVLYLLAFLVGFAGL